MIRWYTAIPLLVQFYYILTVGNTLRIPSLDTCPVQSIILNFLVAEKSGFQKMSLLRWLTRSLAICLVLGLVQWTLGPNQTSCPRDSSWTHWCAHYHLFEKSQLNAFTFCALFQPVLYRSSITSLQYLFSLSLSFLSSSIFTSVPKLGEVLQDLPIVVTVLQMKKQEWMHLTWTWNLAWARW